MTSYTGYIVKIDTAQRALMLQEEPVIQRTSVEIVIREGVHLDTTKPVTITQEEKE